MALPAAMLVVGARGASAAPTVPCEVTNSTTGTGPVDDLQLALDAAQSGDRLQVRGTCVGTFTVTKSVVLIGVSGSGEGRPTLDGGGAGTVLTLIGERQARIEVRLRDLTVRNGHAPVYGGGISSRRVNLALSGATTVTSNEAQHGGGVSFSLGRLVLADTASIIDNRTYSIGGAAGGIGIRKGLLVLKEKAVIARNTAAVGGGVNTGSATVRLRGAAAVVANEASNGGGGIFTYDAPVIMRGSATVAGNHAGSHGGGVYLGGYRSGYVSLTVSKNASISHNTSSIYGGGIESGIHGVVTLKGDAEVSGNTATTGGGIVTAGVTTLEDDVMVTRNSAATGGGVYVHSSGVYVGTLSFGGSSSVTSNTASVAGGGLFVDGSVTFGTGWTGTVCGNDPDDWPGCLP